MGIEKSDDRADKEAKSLADEFMEWEQGGVYVMAVTWPDGEEDYMGNIYGLNPYDRQEVIEAAHEVYGTPKEKANMTTATRHPVDLPKIELKPKATKDGPLYVINSVQEEYDQAR